MAHPTHDRPTQLERIQIQEPGGGWRAQRGKFTGLAYLAWSLLFLTTAPAAAQSLWERSVPGERIGLPSLAPLVTQSKPALVVVRTPKAPLPEGHPPIPEELQRGEATGFIIHRDGFVLTNHHTVGCERVIKVKAFGHEAWHDAKVIGSDKETDIALLKLPARDGGWPFLKVAESTSLRVGDFVLALGHPQGLRFSASLGILSGKGRDTGSEAEYGYLQTDAAINPGNSGGPLLDLAGGVVGINSAIDPRSKGIAYAIPVDVVERVLPMLQKHGRLPRGWLGIGIADVAKGIRVQSVAENSPARKFGLLPDDVIVAMGDAADGMAIADFRREVRLLGPGAVVTLKVLRGVETLALKVTLGTLPAAYLVDQCAGEVPTSQPSTSP